MDIQLLQQWKSIQTILERARSALSAPNTERLVEFESAIAEYRHFLEHNELELALDTLVAAANVVAARGGVWRDFERAADLMGLAERKAEFRGKYLDAVRRR